MANSPGDLIDLSPVASPRIGVWPTDTEMSREVLSTIEGDSSVDLSTLHATVHLGTHADAWSHTKLGEPSIEQMPLDAYIGSCQVVHVDIGRNELITPNHLPPSIDAARLLVGTGSYPNPEEFTTDFAAFDSSVAEWFADQGGRLLAIDTPSVDLFDSTELPTHRACVANRLAILEGIVLTAVPEGIYELMAVPLALEGFDASPVRAVLRVL